MGADNHPTVVPHPRPIKEWQKLFEERLEQETSDERQEE